MSGEVTVEVIITDDERGSTTISRCVNLSPSADIAPRSPEEAHEMRMHQKVGAAKRLDTIAREAASVAAALHLT